MKIISDFVDAIALPSTSRPTACTRKQQVPRTLAMCRKSFSKVWILTQGLHMFVIPTERPPGRPAPDDTRSHVRNVRPIPMM